MPWASKTKVLASDSAPWGGSSFPLKTKFTPAALPTRTVISLLARTVVWAGAMSVSWATGSPSAEIEIQELSVARIMSVRGLAAGVEFAEVEDGALATCVCAVSAAGVGVARADDPGTG